jgi:hypothetical protein
MKTTMVVAAFALGLSSAGVLAVPEEGDRTALLAGSGTGDKDFDNSTFGATASIGWFNSKELQIGLRQSLSFKEVANDDFFDGGTRGFVDYHFDFDTWQPYIGANLGYVYGDTTKDSFAAGPEVGLKAYVKPKTFVTFGIEYQFLFEDVDEAEDQFDDAILVYTVGTGFHF